MIKPVITKAADFSITIQIVTEPYIEGLMIRSSSTANPSVIETELPHQLTTNDRVRITGHRRNAALNGKRTVTAIDAFTFTVGVAGSIIGEASGRVSKCVNITGYVFSVRLLNQKGGTANASAVPTLTVVTLADGECKITLTKAQTPNIIGKSCVIEITDKDTANFTRVRSIECEVVNA